MVPETSPSARVGRLMIRLYLAACVLALSLVANCNAAQDEPKLRALLNQLEAAEHVDDQLDALNEIEFEGIKSPKAVPRLTPYLQSDSAIVKVRAAMALRAVGAETEVVRAVLKDKDPDVRADLAVQHSS